MEVLILPDNTKMVKKEKFQREKRVINLRKILIILYKANKKGNFASFTEMCMMKEQKSRKRINLTSRFSLDCMTPTLVQLTKLLRLFQPIKPKSICRCASVGFASQRNWSYVISFPVLLEQVFCRPKRIPKGFNPQTLLSVMPGDFTHVLHFDLLAHKKPSLEDISVAPVWAVDLFSLGGKGVSEMPASVSDRCGRIAFTWHFHVGKPELHAERGSKIIKTHWELRKQKTHFLVHFHAPLCQQSASIDRSEEKLDCTGWYNLNPIIFPTANRKITRNQDECVSTAHQEKHNTKSDGISWKHCRITIFARTSKGQVKSSQAVEVFKQSFCFNAYVKYWTLRCVTLQSVASPSHHLPTPPTES